MDVDDLYGLPLDRFVPERTALARALRADGRREEAETIAGLRKPSVAAWAVNQLIRTQQQAVSALVKAGDALRQAQDDVLGGRGDGRALRTAAEAEREAVDTLVSAARGLLTASGHELSSPVVDRVADTLHAAALDEDARAQVGQARLERELRHVGLGVGAGFVSVPPPKQGAHAPQPSTPSRKPAAEERAHAKRRPRDEAEQPTRDRAERAARNREQRAALERAERERTHARRTAREAQAEARRRAQRADRAVQVAQERRDRAAQALADAEETLTEARVQAQDAADARTRAQEDLDALDE